MYIDRINISDTTYLLDVKGSMSNHHAVHAGRPCMNISPVILCSSNYETETARSKPGRNVNVNIL